MCVHTMNIQNTTYIIDVFLSVFQSDNEVTINSFDVDIPDNDVMDSWTYDLANNLIGSTIAVKKNCPDLIEVLI